ncbi:MarR family transcriptional regulator [Azorhizobium oxalatiphilum]|uniref:MarR family transcriptional regulator n=1 Tax=Azorhizobium oxalatiphilum TaxID=980631 RepID=A0A917CHG6_9HYPH|nr:MarR family winged helix-turn-helix transcriptional regulator [Azorhizobium oxalatiphilum]GGF85874.1 MarR family transcriptional regulator [Azorhizobium oxalatiphilum]
MRLDSYVDMHADAPIMASIDPALLSLVSQTCVCRRVQRASRTVGKRFDEAVRPLGLNNWQFTMLMALTRTAAPTVNQLAADLAMDRTTVTKNLRPLERRGLLEIRADEKDGRVRRIVLTETGRTLLADAIERWKVVNQQVAAGLSPETLAALMTGLEALATE